MNKYYDSGNDSEQNSQDQQWSVKLQNNNIDHKLRVNRAVGKAYYYLIKRKTTNGYPPIHSKKHKTRKYIRARWNEIVSTVEQLSRVFQGQHSSRSSGGNILGIRKAVLVSLSVLGLKMSTAGAFVGAFRILSRKKKIWLEICVLYMN